MQFIKNDINIDFIGKRKIAFIASLTLIIASILSLAIHKGPRLGVDFAGGSSIQIKFEVPVTIDDIKTGLAPLGLEKSSIQQFGTKKDNEFQIRTTSSFMTKDNFQATFKESLKSATGHEPEVLSTDMVGPQVSKDLRGKALFAMFYALLFITIYISGRFELKWMISGVMAGALMTVVYVLSMFNVSIPILILAALAIAILLCWKLELKYAMGAIVALIHDVTITVGLFSIFNLEFNLPIIAALLTIIGYSLNDTIIVFDRIRENTKKNTRSPLEETINHSINETLSRTILTSLTTLFVVVTLLILGGATIRDFSFAMTVGIAVGTYSSIFVASPILIAWQEYR